MNGIADNAEGMLTPTTRYVSEQSFKELVDRINLLCKDKVKISVEEYNSYVFGLRLVENEHKEEVGELLDKLRCVSIGR